MNNLRLELNNISEVVNNSIIHKLYKTTLEIPEPNEGEEDNAYLSGNLLTLHSYRNEVGYLTTRFPNLFINVTNGYYILFEDPTVLSILMSNNISSDGIAITEEDAATATLGTIFQDNTDITSFDEFKYFTRANTNPVNGMFKGCTNLSSIDLSNVTSLSGEEFKQTGLVNVVLPENITTIVASCFANAYSLLSASAPGVMVIGDRAFDMCGNLTSFSDFSNVTSIGTNSFLNAPLTGVLNAPKLSHLEMAAFKGNAFEGIECIGTLSSIPDTAFGRDTWSNSLHYVYLPYECTQIERYAFARNGGLSTLKQYDKTISDYAEGETKTFLSGLKITVFGANCFKECSSLVLTNDDITNATSIGDDAFELCQVTGSISLPNLTSLGEDVFFQVNTLPAVECLGKVNNIKYHCFAKCGSLQTVKIPYECVSFGDGAFLNDTSLTSITQYNKSLDSYAEGETPTFTDLSRVTSFGINCFYKCNQLLMSGSELSSATYIGHNAFEGVQLSGALDLSSLSGTIGEYTFYNTPITSVTIPLTVTRIDLVAFGNTNLTSITIPLSVQRCSCAIVTGTAVTEIIFPEGCTLITDQQFSTKNNSLVYVEMPSTVTSIGSFFHRSLEDSSDDLCTVVIKATTPPTLIYYKNNASSTTGNKFSGIYVPDASLTAYQGATGAWQHSSILAKLKPISLLLTDNPTAWARYNRTSTV